MTNKELTYKFIDLNEKSVLFMERVSNVLVQLNDNNKLHTQAITNVKEVIKTNTNATQDMTKSFDKFFKLLILVIIALIVLAGAEKALKFIPGL